VGGARGGRGVRSPVRLCAPRPAHRRSGPALRRCTCRTRPAAARAAIREPAPAQSPHRGAGQEGASAVHLVAHHAAPRLRESLLEPHGGGRGKEMVRSTVTARRHLPPPEAADGVLSGGRAGNVRLVTTARWSFDATAEAPGDARRAIGEFAASAGATTRAHGSIALCVSEAVTNVVVHAYRNDDRPAPVEMKAEHDGESLWVRIRDRGHGLRPRLDSPGLGLGLPLISQMSASSEIVSPQEGGTEIVMRFVLSEQQEAL
jgi:serine/threonine-protein kinase RsbW